MATKKVASAALDEQGRITNVKTKKTKPPTPKATKPTPGRVKVPKNEKPQPVKPKKQPAERIVGPGTDYLGRISNAPKPQPGQPGWVNMPDRPGFVPTPRVPVMDDAERQRREQAWRAAGGQPGMAYAGGSPTFDESGRNQMTPEQWQQRQYQWTQAQQAPQQQDWMQPAGQYNGAPEYKPAKLTNVKTQYKTPKW